MGAETGKRFFAYASALLQWNLVNTVTNGSKKWGRFNGAESNFIYTIHHRIHTSCTTVFSF